MRLIWKYVVGQFRQRWFASLLVVAALMTSVAMVMVVVGGEDIVMGQAVVQKEKAGNALGRFHLLVKSSVPRVEAGKQESLDPGPPPLEFKPAILEWLHANKDVAYSVECCEADVDVSPAASASSGDTGGGFGGGFGGGGFGGGVARRPLFGVINPLPEAPYPMYAGRWLSGQALDEVVVDWNLASRVVRDPNAPQRRRPTTGQTTPGGPQYGRRGGFDTGLPGGRGGAGGPGGFAERLPTPPANTVGSAFQMNTETGDHDLKICGVLKTPPVGRRDTRGLGGFYVSAEMFQSLTGHPAKTNRILIELKDGVSVESFARNLAVAAEPTGQQIQTLTEEDFEADASVPITPQAPSVQRSMPFLHNAAMGLAVLTAMFIIFSTLSMGLAENGRRLAMLRVIGMTRAQILVLILAEMAGLTVIG